MKRIFYLFAVLVAVSCGSARHASFPYAVAHRGCWLMEGKAFYINENCPAGVRMAAQYGYPSIECDVQYTSDSVMVLMHDETINRTMRNASDYSEISTPVKVTDHTFEELRSRYVLASSDPALRVPIPTLEELLDTCLYYGVVPMLHSAIDASFRLAFQNLGDGFIAFGGQGKALSDVRGYSDCLILVNQGSGSVDLAFERLGRLGGKCGISSMNHDMMDAAFIRTLREAGYEVQASIFKAPHEQRALQDGVSIQLSDFYWHQTDGRRPVATFRERRKTLPAGESLTWTASAPKFSGVTLDLDFTGTVEVTFCGRVYSLTHDAPGEVEHFGVRLYGTDPEVSVRAVTGAKIRSVRAELYDCGK